MNQLTTSDHSRDVAGMTYVYPVVSRRAGGVSIGVNLNPNNACNWRCIYCQVPDLHRGGPPPIDLALLEQELRSMLHAITRGDYLEQHVPEGMRQLHDVALSGNGEPTTALEFAEVVEIIGRLLDEYALLGRIKLVLITNGSQLAKAAVQTGIRRMAQLNGEIWFKFDRATRAGIKQVNDTEQSPEKALANLKTCAALCPTWLQTCMFALDGKPPPDDEIDAYLAQLQRIRREALPVQGVLLYGLARPSLQPEAPRLSPLPENWMQGLGARISRLGLPVRISP